MSACKICGSDTDELGRVDVLSRHEAIYRHCSSCGFVFPQDPYWLDEAYDTAITASDLGLARRNITLSTQTKIVIDAFFNPAARFVDFGGGYGLFVRLMRDAGYDFYRQDKYSANLFAQHFDAAPPAQTSRYELLTAFEVFEHLENPLVEISEMFHYADSILFTTRIVPQPPPALTEWWYYGLEHGQHIALFSGRSLRIVAQHFGCSFYSFGDAFHLFTPKRISSRLFRFLSSYRIALVYSLLRRRSSLIHDDFRRLTGHELH